MTRLGTNSLLAGLLLLFAGASASSAPTNGTPDFWEVYELIRAHATGLSEAELNRAAVAGLLGELGPRVSLLTNGPGTNTLSESPAVSKTTIFEENIAYVRIGRVAETLAGQVRTAYQQMRGTNKLKGLVLDLRYCDGEDYAAAMKVVELFALKKTPSLDWGAGTATLTPAEEPLAGPLVVLVNGQTRGAAEALAAMLRESEAGLLLGQATAGAALITKDFPLQNGRELRIATGPVKLNSAGLSRVRPDIAVAVNPQDELAYFTNAFLVLPKTRLSGITNVFSANSTGMTTSARRQWFSEAELVREHREALDQDRDSFRPVPPPPRETEPQKPSVHDPVLARALDLLKGLAAVGLSSP